MLSAETYGIERVKRVYPENWAAIRDAVRERAGYVCEQCGAVHGQPHPVTGRLVTLNTAHRDEAVYDDPAPSPDAFIALCAPCHGRYDAEQHDRVNRAHYGTAYSRFGKGSWQQVRGTRKTAPRWTTGVVCGAKGV